MNLLPSSRFRDTFANRHVILPVVHVTGGLQAIRNSQLARTAGADGVFLINHRLPGLELLRIYQEVAAAVPDWWIGVNRLDVPPNEVFSGLSSGVSGVWADNAMIQEGRSSQPAADRIAQARRDSGFGGLYFGGVAFKYQRHVSDLADACGIASGYMDVVTTSGPGTGSAASLDKIRSMKQALGSYPLAIASGITPDNVVGYLGMADCFLVATGVSRSFEEFDPCRLEALVQRVRSFNVSDGGTSR